MNQLNKTGNIAPFIKATSQAVASGVKPVPKEVKAITTLKSPYLQPTISWNYSWKRTIPQGDIAAKHGSGVTTQYRFSHTDLQVPDFSAYRRSSTLDPTVSNREDKDSRKGFSYMITGAGAIGATYAAKSLVTQLVMQWSASADVLALAKVEILLGDIPEGKSLTFKWRGKPLFVRHRTAAEIETEQSTSLSLLRDPETDSARTKRPEWLVVLGVCTHLGCVPIVNAGDYGGYYCPCHGSHYDASGRIRKGPAPLNLEVPPYEFVEDLLIVG